MACSSGSSNLAYGSSLEQLIEEINFQRAKEMRQLLKDDSGFVMLHGTAYWTDLFVRHFLMEEDRSAQESDDLLFFIRKRHLKEAKKYVPKYETLLEVQRRDSRKLPIGDPEIDWEETIYANLIIHRFDYYVTLAVCTRTSPKELQVLKRHTERVWASPSRRLMSDKGTSEDITYPNICFMLDNFDEAFTEIVVRDGEMVSVELVARDRSAALQSVIFLGSVRYDALKRVYDARTSLTAKVAQRVTFGLFAAADAQRMEFVRVKGPMGKGHAELAVTKPPGVDCESPTSEPACSLTEQAWSADQEELCRHRQRRASDPSGNLNSHMSSNFRVKSSGGSQDRFEGLDTVEDSINEVEAADPKDDDEPSAAAERGSARVDSPAAEEAGGGGGQVGAAASGRTTASVAATEEDGSGIFTESAGGRGAGASRVAEEEAAPEAVAEESHRIGLEDRTGSTADTEVAVDATECLHRTPAAVADDDDAAVAQALVDTGENAAARERCCLDEGVSEAEAEARRPAEGARAAENRHVCDVGEVSAPRGPAPPAGDPAGSHVDADATGGQQGDAGTVSAPASTTAAPATTAGRPGSPGYQERPASSAHAVGDRRASCSDAAAAAASRARPAARPAVVTPGMLYRRACGQGGAAATAARCACARTPDGTVVHYRCHVQKAFLSQRELDDGVCNPIWTMRGFSQTFHFWKETKRASSLPLNAYLTYVMLPWHAIINDLIAKENRQDPILSF